MMTIFPLNIPCIAIDVTFIQYSFQTIKEAKKFYCLRFVLIMEQILNV